jgi:hypothetical protein
MRDPNIAIVFFALMLNSTVIAMLEPTIPLFLKQRHTQQPLETPLEAITGTNHFSFGCEFYFLISDCVISL